MPALLRRPELGRQSVMDRAGPRNAANTLKRRAHHQHAVVRLAAGLGAGVSRVTGTVVLDLQQLGAKAASAAPEGDRRERREMLSSSQYYRFSQFGQRGVSSARG